MPDLWWEHLNRATMPAMTKTHYAVCWYNCKLVDTYDSPEPDWSKVPKDKLVQVRMKFIQKASDAAPEVLLWGPQIPFFQSLPYYHVIPLMAVTPCQP